MTSWIADADLDALSAGKPVSAVSVAVLLTKNQLSDLQRQLKIIIDNAERTRKTDSRDFFQGILSASAQLARDPAAFSQKPGANLRDMGVLGEFLDDLPYKSDIMLLSEDDWYRMSVGEQTASSIASSPASPVTKSTTATSATGRASAPRIPATGFTVSRWQCCRNVEK